MKKELTKIEVNKHFVYTKEELQKDLQEIEVERKKLVELRKIDPSKLNVPIK